MPLEATVLVLDNSEWMRNGDYTPSRLEAQSDAVNLLFNVKTQTNPENTVGLMTMGGASPKVDVTLTRDVGKILSALHNIQISGSCTMSNGIQIAQLVLKYRQNKNQRQRIVVFVGSPVAEDEATLVRLGKKLKKNNVAVDVVNFGEEADNTAKLEAFVAAVSSSDNSHLVSVPPGPHLLSDMLLASPIIEGGEGTAAAAAAAGAGFEFGVDPSLDPELALALRISMEEEKARQEAAAGKVKSAGGEGGAASGSGEAASGAHGGEMDVDGESAEDAALRQALAMSMGDAGAAAGGDAGHAGGDDYDVAMTEEEQIARAIAMSMEMEAKPPASDAKKPDSK